MFQSLTGNGLFDVVPMDNHPLSCVCFSCQVGRRLSFPRADFYLALEMPGTKRSSISVKFKGDYLLVEYTDRFGEFKNTSYLLSEKIYDREKIECKYEDGLLTVKVPALKPKTEEKPPETEIAVDIK